MIKFENVFKEYNNGVAALSNINIEIPRGDFVFLVGPSGAGKSTMIPYLVCDEPTGNLDENTAWDIMKALKNINDDGKTVIMATHAVNIVNKFNKRVVTLNKGKIISDVREGGYYENNKTIL